ncbi:MAG: TetR/AcrR family transcriptional regulator [Deltaproteobacteria bacterium]|nr:TetR/AcrR family transcriptional regulator [Deltaproteobacteria bacterium]
MDTRKKVGTNIKNKDLVNRKRKQIIDGAIKAFIAKGFHKSTVKDIANIAGLSMGTLYNYINTKEDILYLVYDYMTNILTEEMERAMSGIEDPKERLRAALKQNANTIYKYQDIVRLLYRESASHDRSTLHTVLSRETEYIELFECLLRNCIDAQHIDEDHLKLAADILAYMPVILPLRSWSLKRRFASMENAKDLFIEHLNKEIEFILKKI